MERKMITVDDIQRTGVCVSVEGPGSRAWNYSAELAVRIANDPECQTAIETVFNLAQAKLVDINAVSQAITVSFDLMTQRYGALTGFDSGVAQAANFAVTDELRRRSQLDR